MNTPPKIYQIALSTAISLAITVPSDAAVYTYDRLHRLTKATYNSGQVVYFSYDSAGNLTSATSHILSYRIIIGTDNNQVIIRTPTGELENRFTVTHSDRDISIATIDLDKDGTDEIAVAGNDTIIFYDQQGSEKNTLSIQEINASIASGDTNKDGKLEIVATSKVLSSTNASLYSLADDSPLPSIEGLRYARHSLAMADIDRDGDDEVIAGSLNANKMTVNGITFSVFESYPQTRRASTRKKGQNKVTICHKGKTKAVPEPALKGHLGHGDTLGACTKPSPVPEEPITESPQITEPTPTPEPIQTPEPIPTPEPPQIPEPSPTPSITYGVNVASGDLDGDRKAEIIAAMASKGSRVEIWNADKTLINQFDAFETDNGVVVAVGNVIGSGRSEIIVSDGTDIRIFDAQSNQLGDFQGVDNGKIVSLAVGKLAMDTEIFLAKVESSNTLTTENLSNKPIDGSLPKTTPISENEALAESSNELTTTELPILPPLPTSDTIGFSYKYSGQTLTDALIEKDVSISQVNLAGKIDNQGLVSTATILEGATFTGGKMSGNITNYGTIADITYVGNQLIGGNLAGKITVNSDMKLGLGTLIDVTILPNATIINGFLSGKIVNQGTLLNVTVKTNTTVTGGTVAGIIKNKGLLQDTVLAESTMIRGGYLRGKITGNAKKPAFLKNANILDNTQLKNVIIGTSTQLSTDIEIGENVRFESH